jgi:hypothetical protein
MKTEAQVKKEIRAHLDGLGKCCWYFMPSMNGYGRKGIPDFVGCYRGRLFAIEAKSEAVGAVATPWQERELEKIEAADGLAFVIHGDLRDLQDYLRA